MPAFPKPRIRVRVDFAAEQRRLRAHKRLRSIPAKRSDRFLVATWNIANLGLQKREDVHKRLIAEILSWFDLIAVQELRDNFADLEDMISQLGPHYEMLISDVAGNNERMAFVYNRRKVRLLQKVGEIAIPFAQERHIRLKGIRRKFGGFDRNPYLAAFAVGRTSYLFINVHLYFGSESRANTDRRALETFAVARWADQRRKSEFAFTREIVALGDFNMPDRDPSDSIYKALTSKGLELPHHSSEMGSNLSSDKHYDQIAFFPGATRNCFRQMGVFDFDTVLLPSVWARGKPAFNQYMRYYFSDHRPLWMELAVV